MTTGEQDSIYTQNVPETVPVLATQRFDETSLARYLACVTGETLIDVRQMSAGQSNPTFLIVTDGPEYVLRKQPPGQLMPSAHAIDREFRVLSALHGTGVPVPEAVHYCEDRLVIGTPFYLMERLTGRIFNSPMLETLPQAQRADVYFAMADTLAAVHGVDWQAVGLTGYGKPDNYYERQIRRWTGQWEKSRTRDNVSIDRLAVWLPAHLPDEGKPAIVHGDFRLTNIMFDPSRPMVIGILDWELSTLGPRLADLAHNCINYYLPVDHPASLAGLDFGASGIPTETEYLERYYAATGSQGELSAFHRAFALFRLAVISEGILARAKGGNAANNRAVEAGSRGIMIADRGWEIASG